MSDVAVIAVLLALFLVAAFISWRADRRAECAPTKVGAVVAIPHVSSSDGRPIHPETLHAVSLLVAAEVGRQAHLMHRAVMEQVLAQVAADEAASVDLDDLLREAS